MHRSQSCEQYVMFFTANTESILDQSGSNVGKHILESVATTIELSAAV